MLSVTEVGTALVEYCAVRSAHAHTEGACFGCASTALFAFGVFCMFKRIVADDPLGPAAGGCMKERFPRTGLQREQLREAWWSCW